jgi:pimeloyl-ACP methyl ester carboxylesterase
MPSGNWTLIQIFRNIVTMLLIVQSSSLQTVARRVAFGTAIKQYSRWSQPTSLRRMSSVCKMTIADTSLGTEKGAELLDGLDVYSLPATGDQHPLSVYGINSLEPKEDANVLLLLHGRTWSSVPVYHLHGGPKNDEKGLESHSLMEELLKNNIQPYAMDFRGFGGTPHDSKASTEPNRCVEDVESVLEWIADRHGSKAEVNLLGWSQGALVAHLAAQRRQPLFSKLILYGSIFDPMVRYPREPLYVRNKENATDVPNTYDSAVEDFTIEGTIPPEPAQNFAEAALLSDPFKARWTQLHQFNNCDPARIHVPTLVVRQPNVKSFAFVKGCTAI